MYRQKQTRDPRNLRTISIILLLTGAIITFRFPPARMAGFLLLGAGAFGLIWSLVTTGGWKRRQENEDHRKFF
jgi:hypothetical protein